MVPLKSKFSIIFFCSVIQGWHNLIKNRPFGTGEGIAHIKVSHDKGATKFANAMGSDVLGDDCIFLPPMFGKSCVVVVQGLKAMSGGIEGLATYR